jgi:phosphoribosylaminoimidazolecarboxamide formyltransferase/IMP cyclohydrolase
MQHHVKTALLSVSDKAGLEEFATFLAKQGVRLLSTGGTAKALRAAGLTVVDVSEHTGFPEIMDGRVKTLHPAVHGGILARRSNKQHVAAMKKHDIGGIDMVVVNLYPFEATVKKGAKFGECIENIDIGGPSMIRSAAKNHEDVVVIVNPADYKAVMDEMKKKKGTTTLALRQRLAATAFARTASYDAAISTWFAAQQKEEYPDNLIVTATRAQVLRYGENPHQSAALYLDGTGLPGIATAQQLQGKELSYNNISDGDAAYDLVNEFTQPAVAIIKHANPCGVACGKNLLNAYSKALACDPVSAYGSIIALNGTIDKATAEEIAKLFVEVIIAPDASKEAKEIFAKKKNLRVLLTGSLPKRNRKALQVKTITGGLLVQERDHLTITEKDLQVVTKRKPTKAEIEEMLFAFRVCKHVKSNAIVITKDLCSVGIGAGQMSRIDSVNIAGGKLTEQKSSAKKKALYTVASDAFFPFADGVIAAHKAGVSSVIQPGGSIRDEEVVAAADERGMTMVFTGKRHFRH